jgi:dihydroxyacetone kinase-like predicted kinase
MDETLMSKAKRSHTHTKEPNENVQTPIALGELKKIK